MWPLIHRAKPKGAEGVKEGLLSAGWGWGKELNAPGSFSAQRSTFCLEPESVPWNSDGGPLMPMETALRSPGAGPPCELLLLQEGASPGASWWSEFQPKSPFCFPNGFYPKLWETNISNVQWEMIMRSVGTPHFDSKPGLRDWHPKLGVKILWLLLEKCWAEHQAMGLPEAWPSYWLHVFRTPVQASFAGLLLLDPPPGFSHLWQGEEAALGTEKGDLSFICDVPFLL